ncbi:MAG: IclR family transcriptional regulator [Pseudomonadota bacterium]
MSDKENATAEGRIPTNLRMLMILEAVASNDSALSPTEIGRMIGLPKQTIHRLCATLVAEGFLLNDIRQKGLRPGYRSRRLSTDVLHNSRDHAARHQILIALSRQTGETVNFVVPEDAGMIYRDRVETDWAFRIQLPVGTHVPFHCTASGKTFLASLPTRKRRRMVAALQLEPYTERTITSQQKLSSELESVSAQGFAVDDCEFMDGMVAVAVPLYDLQGRYHASVAVHGPQQRFDIKTAAQRADLLKQAADRLQTIIFDEKHALVPQQAAI